MTPLIYGKGSCDDFILFDEGFFFFQNERLTFKAWLEYFAPTWCKNCVQLFISSKNISCSADERPFFFDLDQRCIAFNLWKSQMCTKLLGFVLRGHSTLGSIPWLWQVLHLYMLDFRAGTWIQPQPYIPRWYVNKRKRKYFVVLYVASISFKHTLLQWLLMSKKVSSAVPALGSSFPLITIQYWLQ